MLLMPVTGILGSLYSRDGLAFFGLPLSGWVTPTRATAKLFFNIHSIAIWVLVALVVLHVLGGLKHLLLDKDRVFQRMWFR
jgi:cytochrome b561